MAARTSGRGGVRFATVFGESVCLATPMTQLSSATRPSIFVSGGAAGIGLAIARRYARAGYRVGVYDLDAEAASRAADQLSSEFDCESVSGELDVTKSEGWHVALADFCGTHGALDILVNNAGVASSGPFADTPLSQHRAMVEVNVMGVIHGCHAAHAYLRRAAAPRVVNLASASAIYGQPTLATYAATKFAVRGLTEGLNLEWEADGIHVTSLMPIFVKTAMVDTIGEIKAIQRLGIKLQPEDVANAAWAAGTGRRKVHRVVGRDAAALRFLLRFIPTSIARRLVRVLAT